MLPFQPWASFSPITIATVQYAGTIGASQIDSHRSTDWLAGPRREARSALW